MRYVRPKHDQAFYLYFLCLNLLCIIIFWTISYLDYINMINNGFVNKSAITFEIEEIEQPLTKVKDPFILFQYNPNMPEVKHVLINGKVKLPPIKKKDEVDITRYNGNVAIVGNSSDIEIPTEYKLIGHFNTPNSYILNSEIWLISNKLDINLEKGTYFTIITPNNDEYTILRKIFSKNPQKIINKEIYGSYVLNSNKLLNIGMLVSLTFLTFIFTMIGTLWINKEKSFVGILYLSGYSIHTVFKKIVKYKILPYILISISLIIICVAVQIFIFPLWTNTWILNSLYMFIGFNVYLLVFSFIKIFSYTVRKGGKRF